MKTKVFPFLLATIGLGLALVATTASAREFKGFDSLKECVSITKKICTKVSDGYRLGHLFGKDFHKMMAANGLPEDAKPTDKVRESSFFATIDMDVSAPTSAPVAKTRVVAAAANNNPPVNGAETHEVEANSSATPSDMVSLKDGSMLTGEITDGNVPFKSSFGEIEVSLGDVLTFSEGKLRFIDGTLFNGEFGDGEIAMATGIGKFKADLSEIVSIERGKTEDLGELSREQAAHLIQRKRGLPQQKTITLVPHLRNLEQNGKKFKARFSPG